VSCVIAWPLATERSRRRMVLPGSMGRRAPALPVSVRRHRDVHRLVSVTGLSRSDPDLIPTWRLRGASRAGSVDDAKQWKAASQRAAQLRTSPAAAPTFKGVHPQPGVASDASRGVV
jgi:hypothetical protein